MLKDYPMYIFYIFVIVVLLAIVFIILRHRKSSSQNTESDLKNTITSGHVSVFFDSGKNVTIIPYKKDKYGVGRAIRDVCTLALPYNWEELGKQLRISLLSCEGGEICTNQELLMLLKSQNWKDFSLGKRNISIHYNTKRGLIFNTTIRLDDGTYRFNSKGYQKVSDSGISDKELGEITLSLLPRCRS
jgi:hypothetical protein